MLPLLDASILQLITGSNSGHTKVNAILNALFGRSLAQTATQVILVK